MKSFKLWSTALAFIAVGGLVLLLSVAVFPAAGQETTSTTVQVGETVAPRLSPVMRDVPYVAPERKLDREEINPMKNPGLFLPDLGLTGTDTKGIDALVEKGVLPEAAPSPLFTFEGQGDFNLYTPPDTTGDVGPNHYVQMVNVETAVYDKAGNLIDSWPNNQLWAGFGGACETSNDGDPIVLYDDMADRWLLSQFAVSSTPQYMCIAISTTPDPTGTYNLYAFPMPDFPDYPKLGVWPDGYYMGTNTGYPNQYYAHVFDRAAMLAGSAAGHQYVGGQGNFLMPADADGTLPPPAGMPGLFYTFFDGGYPNHPAGVDRIAMFEFDVDWATPANSTFTLAQEYPIADFNYTTCGFFVQNCIPEPAPGVLLDGVDPWPMVRFQYRNLASYQALVGNFTVDVDGTNHAGIRWFEMRNVGGNWTLHQEGTFSPDGDNRWMGSIAMDGSGNIALGYSVSSASTIPSIRYTVHEAGDPLGAMQTEATMTAGGGVNTGPYPRWGDYSAMVVDPNDACTFYFTSEYFDVTDTSFMWNTRVGAFRIPSCSGGLGPTGTLSGDVTDGASAPIAGINIAATLSVTQTFNGTSNGAGQYALTLPVGTYDVTASGYGYLPVTVNNVDVFSGTVTDLDFTMPAAPSAVIDGYVTDSLTGWPMYAQITVDGFPGDPIWTDPLTGYYSIELSSGMTYTFHAAPFYSGYLPAARDIYVSGPAQEDFAIDADLASCSAPGYYNAGTAYSEDFEADNGGFTVSGATTTWAWGTPTNGPGAAHSGSNVWATNLTGSYVNYEDGYITSGDIDLSAYTGQGMTLSWWQWLTTEGGYDYASVEVSNNGGSSWNVVYGPEDGTVDTVWTKHSVILDASYSVNNFRIRFHFTSDVSVTYPGWYVDDIEIISGSSCTAPAGGLVLGNTYDASTNTPLVGALVTSDAAATMVSVATPDDDNVDDGFYYLYSDAGDHVFTATMPLFSDDTALVTVPAGDVVDQDFFLDVGLLSAVPQGIAIDVPMGSTDVFTMSLQNLGGGAVNFEIKEKDNGFMPVDAAAEDVLVVSYDTTAAASMESALMALGYTYLDVSDTVFQAMTVDQLLDYSAVFYAGSTSANSRTLLIAYLDAGGALYISDNDLGYFNGTTPFYQDYLQATYLADDGGSPLVGEDIMAGLTLDTSLDPYPDTFALGADAVRIFYFPGNDAGGSKIERNGYLAIYTSFDFDDMAANSDEVELVARIMGYLAAADVPWLSVSPITGTIAGNPVVEAALLPEATGGTPERLPVANPIVDGPSLPPTEAVMDGGFETGSPNAAWEEFSTNFGSPICSVGWCGTGGGTAGAHSGTYWAWFGGAGVSYEQGILTQTVEIPVGTQSLSFWLWIGTTGGPATSYFNVLIDGTEVFIATADQQPSYAAYTEVLVDISAYADGGLHELVLNSETNTVNTNFNVDDVSLVIPNSAAIVLSFDAGIAQVTQPGDYLAELQIKNNTPHGTLIVPITMTVEPPLTFGKLEGTVTGLGYCDADPAALFEAEVFIEASGGMTWTLLTDEAGYYSVWFDESQSPVTITVNSFNHETGVASGVTVTGQQTTTEDFDLRWLEPCVVADPTGLSVSMLLGESETLSFTLTNTGAEATPFEILEIDRTPAEAFLPPADGNYPRGEAAPSFGAAPIANTSVKPAPSIVLPDGTVAYATDASANINVSFDVDVPGVFTNLGAFTPADFPGAGDYYNGYLYILDGVNNLYQVDPATGGIVSTITTSPAPGAQSWTGMAVDPTSGAVYVSACDITTSSLGMIDIATGVVTPIGTITNSPCTIGIAIDNTGQMYGFDITNDSLMAIDKNTAAGSIIGSLGFDANYGQGMGYDPDTDTLYLAAFNNGTFLPELRIADRVIGNTTLVGTLGDGTGQLPWLGFPITVGGDVPWLSENPTTGNLPADTGLEVIEVTFDSSQVTQPGDYLATLNIDTDDPTYTVKVWVTMTVEAPGNYGILEGTVTGLGYCDADPAALEEAMVYIESASGVTTTLLTDAFGFYSTYLDEADSPYLVSVTAENHEDGETRSVDIVGQQTSVEDYDLRELTPCVSVDPTSVEVTVASGFTAEVPLTLINAGAAPSDWLLKEVPAPAMRLPQGPARPVVTAPVQVITIGDVELSASARPAGTASVQPPFVKAPNATTITHSVSQTIISGNSVSCNAGGLHTDNSYLRVFDLPTFGINGAFNVTNVEIGIETAAGASGSQPSTVNLYTLDGALTWANLTLIGTAEVVVADQNLTILNMPVEGTAPAGSVLVVEFFTPSGQAAGNSLFVGSNNLGQTGATYLAAADCGVTEPTDTGTIGFPGMHLVMNVTGETGSSDILWVTEVPTSGNLGADSTFDVMLTFDPITYTVGTYTGTLKLESDDPMYSDIEIPLTLHVVDPEYGVTLPADMELTGEPGDELTFTVYVTNTGNGPDDTFDIVIDAATYSATLDVTTVGPLALGESGMFVVTVTIPADALNGDHGTVQVSATSQGDPSVFDAITLTANVEVLIRQIFLPLILRAIP